MVGSRPHVSWGAMDAGPARCFGDWMQFRQLTEEHQSLRLSGMRGVQHMISDIETAIPEAWLQPRLQLPISWMGAFTRLEVLIAVRGTTEDCTLMYEVGEGGRLHRVRCESELVGECVFQRIRVVGACGKTWHIDPDPDTITVDSEWRLWAWESRPLARLQWDPGE